MTPPRLARALKIRFAGSDDEPLYLDVVHPEGAVNLPVILVVHGGGWCLLDRKSAGAIPPLLARNGYIVVNIDYRLAPLHLYPAAVEDINAAVTWITAHAAEYGGDPSRIGGIGFSAGGHLVGLAATAADSPFACAVSWAGPMDLRHEAVTTPYRGFLLGFLGACRHEDPELYNEASPICRLAKDSRPLLLVHGDEDDVVPLRQSMEMARAAEQMGARVEVLALPGAGHVPGDPREPVMHTAWSRIDEFFAHHLISRPGAYPAMM